MINEQEQERKPSAWVQHMMQFVEQKVTVTYYLAGQGHEVEGTLRFFNFNKDSCLVETENESMWIRSPITIKKKI